MGIPDILFSDVYKEAVASVLTVFEGMCCGKYKACYRAEWKEKECDPSNEQLFAERARQSFISAIGINVVFTILNVVTS